MVMCSPPRFVESLSCVSREVLCEVFEEEVVVQQEESESIFIKAWKVERAVETLSECQIRLRFPQLHVLQSSCSCHWLVRLLFVVVWEEERVFHFQFVKQFNNSHRTTFYSRQRSQDSRSVNQAKKKYRKKEEVADNERLISTDFDGNVSRIFIIIILSWTTGMLYCSSTEANQTVVTSITCWHLLIFSNTYLRLWTTFLLCKQKAFPGEDQESQSMSVQYNRLQLQQQHHRLQTTIKGRE